MNKEILDSLSRLVDIAHEIDSLSISEINQNPGSLSRLQVLLRAEAIFLDVNVLRSSNSPCKGPT